MPLVGLDTASSDVGAVLRAAMVPLSPLWEMVRGCRSSRQCCCHASHAASPAGTFALVAVVVSRSFLLVCSQSREAVTAL